MSEATPQPTMPGAGRLMSLDVFRGVTIASMMLVNNPGNWSAVYPPLLHAEWHGWTFTDTIFPFFNWIVVCEVLGETRNSKSTVFSTRLSNNSATRVSNRC